MTDSTQQPVNSGFGAFSEPDEVLVGIDLAGKQAVVTGGYSGIGLETVRALAKRGVKVLVPVRDPTKAESALADMEGDVATAVMDLADLASVQRFADQVVADWGQLDLLINNAGIMACPETRTDQGWEMQFAVNHIGHFVLAQGLMPLLQKTDAPRVVALSSTGHKQSPIRWDDPFFTEEPYDKWVAYGQSKTANALFARALHPRLAASGGHAFGVHPGGIVTPLQRHLQDEEMVALGWKDETGDWSEAAKAMFKSPTQGCTTTLWAATSPMLADKGGQYCEDCDIAAPSDPDNPVRYKNVEAHACDDEAAERLWAMTEELLAYS
ncbi:MAG: oxidoreductase [Pseudomonadota bacterium]